ncbi:uncharacterized protein LOC130498445 [Raphanus sativus]|uniref:Uncharacterized protein LOC130498445 n=1 Tax=Raphanus sativus TaxID=3726 RepID=A0A9W3C8K8_RAPSA|nr:uncharacterized protein LOC130498445 [Raphanus sativus]
MLQIFVDVMTRAFPDYLSQKKDLLLLQNIASYMLLACGLIYFISGVLCIGFLKRARQQKEISREQAVKDLEEIDRRREELEQLVLLHRSRVLLQVVSEEVIQSMMKRRAQRSLRGK